MDYKGKNPTMQRVVVTNPNTEKSVIIPSGTYNLKIQAESSAAVVRLAFTSGEVSNGGGSFWKLRANQTFEQNFTGLSGRLYLATVTGLSGEIIDILTWA